MLSVAYAHQFKKDWKKLKASAKNLSPARSVMESLAKEQRLAAIYDDNPLRGPWQNHRSCHPQSDTVLIYHIRFGKITLERIGSHAELHEL